MAIDFKYDKYNLGDKPSLHLKKLLPLIKEKKINKILDFGCGNGRNSFFLKKQGFDIAAIDSAIVIDKHKTMFKNADISVKSYNINTTKIPFKPNSFDAIIAWRVLHRGLKGYRQELKKVLHNLLKYKGYLIVAISTDKDIKPDENRREHKEIEKNTFEYISKGVKNKRHYYTKEEILNGSEFPGFKVISIDQFKEKTGHKEKSYFRYYWRMILQKK
jgi:SAM-dependent methyltransferase